MQHPVGFYILFQISGHQQLPQEGHPVCGLVVLATAKISLLIGSVRLYEGIGLAHQYVHNFLAFVLFVGFGHYFQQALGLFFGFVLLFGMAHIVVHHTALSGFIVKFFPKIMQNKLSARDRGLGKSHYLLQQGVPYFLFGNRLAAHKFFQFFYILIAVKSQAMALAPITPRTAGLLIVAFYALGHIVVDHKPYVWLVNAHAKSNSGNHHIHIFHKEHILVLYTRFGIKAGMVGYGLNAIYLKGLCQFLYPFSAQAIDYATLPLVLLNKTDDV